MTTSGPTLAGFLAFVRNVMAITTAQLPDSSIYLNWALANAIAIVNPQLSVVPGLPQTDAAGIALFSDTPPSIYTEAVYNLAADNLVNYAQDQNGETFFGDLRKSFNINGFVSGVISSSNDQSTGQSLVVQEAAKAFTLKDLQNLKTPWGRTYLGIAQSYGPSTWGLTC